MKPANLLNPANLLFFWQLKELKIKKEAYFASLFNKFFSYFIPFI